MKNKKLITGSISGSIAVIIGAIFMLEAGYSDHPLDPGGATNHGVTEAVARQYGYEGDMKDLPKELAADIYYTAYIHEPKFHLIVEVDSVVAEELIDSGVNTGTRRAAIWFQEALNALNRGEQDYDSVIVDGVIGSKTIDAFNALREKRGNQKACELVIKLMDAQQAVYYMRLIQLRTFTVGWIDHRIGNVDLSRCGN